MYSNFRGLIHNLFIVPLTHAATDLAIVTQFRYRELSGSLDCVMEQKFLV